MALEIERKFLVASDAWRSDVGEVRRIRQGYLTRGDKVSIRLRLDDGGKAALTIKAAAGGITRHEFEYPIPVADAEAMLALVESSVIIKSRHKVPVEGLMWEIDVFEGANAGLVIAEIELERADQEFGRPPWLGEEVTHISRYYNSALAEVPYASWTTAGR